MRTAPGAPMQNRSVFITRTVQPWPDLFERAWDGGMNHGQSTSGAG
jgi:hypothetical protein